LIIKNIKIVVCCPGRNFVTVKIVTDAGIYGLGDATLNGRGYLPQEDLQSAIQTLLPSGNAA